MPKGMEYLYKTGTKKLDPKKMKKASPATQAKAKRLMKKAKKGSY